MIFALALIYSISNATPELNLAGRGESPSILPDLQKDIIYSTQHLLVEDLRVIFVHDSIWHGLKLPCRRVRPNQLLADDSGQELLGACST